MSIDLSREKDPEILRQAALLLEAENKRLVAQVMDFTRRLLEAEGKERVALQLEIQALQAQLAKRNRALFGESSEQRKSDTAAEPKEPKKAKKGHGPTKQEPPVSEELSGPPASLRGGGADRFWGRLRFFDDGIQHGLQGEHGEEADGAGWADGVGALGADGNFTTNVVAMASGCER